MSVLDLALRIAGMPSETIDEIDKAMPGTAALIKLVKDNEQLVRDIVALAADAQPLLARAQPLLAKAIPVIKQAMPEIEALLPTAQDVIAFLQKQQAKSDQIAMPDSPNVGA